MFSAVHPTTDIAKILRHVRFVPNSDIPSSSIRVIFRHGPTAGTFAVDLNQRIAGKPKGVGRFNLEMTD
jgi:hypothetical protein